MMPHTTQIVILRPTLPAPAVTPCGDMKMPEPVGRGDGVEVVYFNVTFVFQFSMVTSPVSLMPPCTIKTHLHRFRQSIM